MIVCLLLHCSLGGLVLKRGQKEVVSRSQEDLPSCGSISTPQCIFKTIARRILSALSEILNRFSVEMYLFFLSAEITH